MELTLRSPPHHPLLMAPFLAVGDDPDLVGLVEGTYGDDGMPRPELGTQTPSNKPEVGRSNGVVRDCPDTRTPVGRRRRPLGDDRSPRPRGPASA